VQTGALPTIREKVVRVPQNLLVTEAELKRCILELNNVVGKHSKGSVLRGLDVLSAAFAGMLDMYAQPNEENPEGMCDDHVAFRHIYADAIMQYPLLERKLATGKPEISGQGPRRPKVRRRAS
jgi:hypothetical protein